MDTGYTAFIHGTPSDLQQSQSQLEQRSRDAQDAEDDLHDDIDVHDDEDLDEDDGDDEDDEAGLAGDESYAPGNSGQNQHPPPTGNGSLHSPQAFSQPPFPVTLPYPMPYIQSPYFFIQPPHHNPYSPTGGAGHLHPPTISQAPFVQESYDPTDFLQDDPSSSQPPSKRPRKTNIDPEAAEANRPVEELFEELDEEHQPQQSINGKNSSASSKVNGYRFKCLLCESRFPRKNAVVAHIKTHLGKRKYTCSSPGCNMAFVREHDCKRHEATHTGTRPFVCICGRPFARPDALRRHRERGHCSSIIEGGPVPPPPPKWKGSGRPSNLARAAAAAAASQQGHSNPTASTSGQPESNSDQDPPLHVGASLFDEEQTAAILHLERHLHVSPGSGNPNGMDLDLALNGTQIPGGLSDPSTGFPTLFGIPHPPPTTSTSNHPPANSNNVSFVRGGTSSQEGNGVIENHGAEDPSRLVNSKTGKGTKKGSRTSKRNRRDAQPGPESGGGYGNASVADQLNTNHPPLQHQTHPIPPSQFHPFMDLPHQSGLLQPPLSGPVDPSMSLVELAVGAATRLQVQQAQARAQAQAQQRASPRPPVMGLDSLGAGMSMLGVDGPSSQSGNGRQMADVLQAET